MRRIAPTNSRAIPWLWWLADLTAVLVVAWLPVSELLRNNPYFKFKYGFDQTLLALMLVGFVLLPWLLLGGVSLMAARWERPHWRRYSLLLVVIMFASQFYSGGLQQASPLLRIGIAGAALLGGGWLALRRTRDLSFILAIGLLLAGPFSSFQAWRHWWSIPKPPANAQLELHQEAGGDLFVILLDGCAITTDHLDADLYPDAALLPNFHRFIREDAQWFPNAVSNAPVTTFSLPSMLTGKLHASRANNYLANAPNLFSILDPHFDIRGYLFTKSCFCQNESFAQCYPFQSQNYREPLGMLGESLAFLSSFRLSPLSFEIGMLNDAAYDRESYVNDFLSRLREPASVPRFFAIQLFDREDEKLRRFDVFFGQFVEQLQSSGRYENATIAVVSDHGFNVVDGNIEYGFDTEQTQRLYRVPFAMKTAGRGDAAVYDYVAQGIDIVPTILGSVSSDEAVAEYNFDGVDLLRNQPQRPHYFTLQDRDNLYRFDAEAKLIPVSVDSALEDIRSAH